MKRSTPDAKVIVLQLILQLICTEPAQLWLLSRMFSMINSINYDQKKYDSRHVRPASPTATNMSGSSTPGAYRAGPPPLTISSPRTNGGLREPLLSTTPRSG